jgi:uncharacterized protein
VDTVQKKKLPFLFFVLVFASSLPIWVIGVWFRLELLPGVPIAGLTFVCPAIAALVCH